MTSSNSRVLALRDRAIGAVAGVAYVAAKGLPAIRAAMHGARIGAGRQFAPEVLEKLGMRVIRAPSRAVGAAIAAAKGPASFVLERSGNVLRASSETLVLHAKDGVAIEVSRSGAAVATATTDAIRGVARVTSRGALAGIGRAAAGGAMAGAAVDAVACALRVVPDVRAGRMTRADAARDVAVHATRGAVAGGVGVVAAGAVAAGLAFTGLSVAGAPVAIPIATMMVVGSYTARVFDRVSARLQRDRAIRVEPSAR